MMFSLIYPLRSEAFRQEECSVSFGRLSLSGIGTFHFFNFLSEGEKTFTLDLGICMYGSVSFRDLLNWILILSSLHLAHILVFLL